MIKFLDINKSKAARRLVRRLYSSAFPIAERAPFVFLQYRSKSNCADFFAVYDNEQFAGLVYNIYYKDLVYVFYLAVDADCRSKGYGSKILKEIQQRFKGKRLILSIEEVNPDSANYEQRKRRKAFYEKNGFRDSGVRVAELGVIYEVMLYGEQTSKEEYMQMMKSFTGNIIYNMFYKNLAE